MRHLQVFNLSFSLSLCSSTHPFSLFQRILDKEYQVLASSYQRQLDLNGGHPEEGEEDLFFVKLEYGSSQQTFASYQLKTVPLMIHIPPDYGSGDASTASHELSARNTYQIPKVPSAENIEGFVRERTAINIPIHRSMVGTYILLFFAFVCLIFVASIVVNHLEFWLKVIRVKMLWVVVSLGVYTCAISGLIFDIIRSPPMYNIHPNTNQIIFFYPQQGNQFVVEGFVIGFLNVAAGLCIFLMMYLPSRIKRLYADPASGSNMASVAAVTFGALFVMIFLYIRALYTLKNRWYMR